MTTYHIRFDTDKPAPGYITATKIVLSKIVTKDKKAVFQVNLSDDPLYSDLVEYVRMNPIVRREPPA